MTTMTTLERGYDQLPVPFGWFAVALSNEIQNGDIRTMRYFGTEFVLWRGGDGALREFSDALLASQGWMEGFESSGVGTTN